MDGGAWWAAVHGVAESRTWLSDFTFTYFHFSLSFIGERNGNPLQCSCLENPRDRGAWWAAVCGVAQSRTRLKRLSSSSLSKGHSIKKYPLSQYLNVLSSVKQNSWQAIMYMQSACVTISDQINMPVSSLWFKRSGIWPEIHFLTSSQLSASFAVHHALRQQGFKCSLYKLFS